DDHGHLNGRANGRMLSERRGWWADSLGNSSLTACEGRRSSGHQSHARDRGPFRQSRDRMRDKATGHASAAWGATEVPFSAARSIKAEYFPARLANTNAGWLRSEHGFGCRRSLATGAMLRPF